MASAIDITKPTEGEAYTVDVRNNFKIISGEITALQNAGPYMPVSGGTINGNLNVGGSIAVTSGGSLQGNYTIGGTLDVLHDATFSSPVLLHGDPAVDLEAATKHYVDSATSGAIKEAPSDGATYGRVNASWTQVLPSTGGTVTGPVTVTHATDANLYVVGTGSSWPGVKWNTTQANTACGYFESQRNGVPRWGIEFGSASAESGSNAGSNLNIARYSDTGAQLGIPFSIARNTGLTTISTGVSFGSQVATASTDFSKHIALYGTTYGISVTTSRLNIVSSSAGIIVFVNGTNDTFSISQTAVLGLGYGAQNKLTITPGAASTNQIVYAQSGTGGYVFTGQTTIVDTPSATSGQLNIAPPGNANALESKLRFRGTFATGADLGARFTASLRSGFSTAAWGTEYLDVWVGYATNDTASDANQRQVARFTNTGVTFPLATTNTGLATYNGGISFGAVVGASNADFSKHITLHTGGFGFGITTARMNTIIPTTSTFNCVFGGNDRFTVSDTALTVGTVAINMGSSALATALDFRMNTAAGQAKSIRFQVAGSDRFTMGATAGDNLTLATYNPPGTNIGNSISIDGASGRVSLNLGTILPLNNAPASATATGTAGEIRVDTGFLYVCTATNTWKRAALTTW